MNSKAAIKPGNKAAESNTTKELYSRILDFIVTKELAPGSKINQIKLAARLKASRTPIVKALHRLESQGLVDNIADSGFFVHKLSMLELLELWQLREALDTIIITELVETITADQLGQLERLTESFQQAADALDDGLYRQTDQEFHSLLLQFSGNRLVKKINEHFQIYNRCYKVGLLRKPHETLPEHRMLVDALRKRDREGAREALAAHIAKTRTFLQELARNLRQVGIDPAKIPFASEMMGQLPTGRWKRPR